MPELESERKDVPESEADTVERPAVTANRNVLDAGEVVAQVVTVAIMGVGCAATLEAALLPGFVLGVAAMTLPKLYPKMSEVSQNKLGTFSNGLRAFELVLNVVNLTRRAPRAPRLRIRSR
jgi:hypothetical protein